MSPHSRTKKAEISKFGRIGDIYISDMEKIFHTESQSTVRKNTSVAGYYYDFLENKHKKKLNPKQKKAFRSWDPKKNAAPPKNLISDHKFERFLRSEWDHANKDRLKVQPHMRKVHAWMSNTIGKHNMKPFRTRKEEKRKYRSAWPKTEETWAGMRRDKEYAL